MVCWLVVKLASKRVSLLAYKQAACLVCNLVELWVERTAVGLASTRGSKSE